MFYSYKVNATTITTTETEGEGREKYILELFITMFLQRFIENRTEHPEPTILNPN
jgi:hypothetical protein